MEFISENIKHWLKLDLQIERQQKELEDLRQQRNTLEKTIIDSMHKNGLSKTTLTADKYKLGLATENEYTHLSYTFVEKSLSSILQDNVKAKTLCEKIKANRQKVQHVYLRRTNIKSNPNPHPPTNQKPN